ncbi:Riboflavin biosynthesis protein ribBA,chloroplastic [Waddlia chondrophila 2032/99]|uniref:Riboflavin biosynthesis protein RibBA n=1 Tax=Waddlia chondrophila 2032/99 TaxID=765953 RepID=F8LD46_9BACT|nr:Riboflavin biosynthesis protein ribBA,chloroplastic [Waddlia chondrophila 2032/99]
MNSRLDKAFEVYRKGGFVIVQDDFDRENEGDLIIAAEKVTPEAIAFMVRYTSGIICVSLKEERLKQLCLPQMVPENTEIYQTAFTIPVDYCQGTTTGVSAEDRAKTIRALVNPDSCPEDFRRPGHVFPLRYCEGGVLKRAGHTEAAVDLAILTGLQPAGVISEIVNQDGSMAKDDQLQFFAKEHDLPLISISDIVRYRREKEKLVECISEARMPTRFGNFMAFVYKSLPDNIEHLALVKGDVKGKDSVLVRVHSECLTGDIFGSKRCDCGNQLDLSLQQIDAEGLGVLIYLRGHEGRGIGLGHKLRAYALQDQGRDTVEANLELGFPIDSREYGVGAQMLSDLGLTTIRLMTNNPSKYGGLEGYDLKIVERVPLQAVCNDENRRYLTTKKEKLGHLLEV